MTEAASQLLTRRLRLQRMTEDDDALMLSVWNDPAFIQFVGDRGIRTLDAARQAMQDGPLMIWREYGYGPYVVSPAEGGQAMGICGLFKRDNLPDPDIGYGFLPLFGGKGYAFEAAEAVRDHARTGMGLARIAAIVSPDNGPSIRLLEKLGMAVEGPIRMPGEDEDILLYGMDL